jgi:glycosyltransferase involved in cell wall biosynthesis
MDVPMTSPAVAPTQAPTDERHPLVSVVVPTRGRPELVRETVASIVAQTYAGPIECLVVHDREEPDRTLAALSTPLRTVVVTTNLGTPGLAGGRNSGIDQSHGPLIASCDDDDLWHPTKVEKQVARMMADPDLIVVGAGLRLLFPNRTAEWPARAEVIGQDLLLRNRVKELHSSTLLVRRDALARIGRYDEELPNGKSEDYDFVLRAVAVGKVGCVVEPLADIRKNDQSWYLGKPETAAGLEMLLAKHPEIATSRRGHARLLGQIAWAHSTAGRRRTALGYALRALRRRPTAPYAHLALLHIVTRVSPNRVLQIARLFRRGIT